MHQHVARTTICGVDATGVVEDVISRLRVHCLSIRRTSTEEDIDFGTGRLLIRPSGREVLFYISASDALTYYGIRLLLEGILSITDDVAVEQIDWRVAAPLTLPAIDSDI